MQINNNGWQQDIPGEIEEEEDNDDDTNRDLELEPGNVTSFQLN